MDWCDEEMKGQLRSSTGPGKPDELAVMEREEQALR
jgi:hypothetical protein